MTATQFPWDPKLETGIVEIDDQHRLLFKKADVVLDAVAAGQGRHEVARTLQFLADYAALHFGTEERYMRAAGYPALEKHLGLHQRITSRLMEMAAEFNADGPTEALVAELEVVMRGWLSVHIDEHDRALAAFLAAAKPAP